MGRRSHTLVGLSIAAVALWPATAWAGMPAPFTLTEMAGMRLEAISFFLGALLASAALIRLLWNSLRESFSRLPILTYWKALGLVMLWGLLFLVVLLMVSAARELMTPGAWQRDGTLYRLTDGGHPK